MKLLLLTVGLGLAWGLQDQSQVPVQPGFHPEQVEGPWHTIKLGATDKTVIEEGGAYLCFMTGITLLQNGNLNVTYFHRKDGKCVKEYYIAEKTDTPGRFTFEYQGKNYLTFVAVTDDITIMDLENQSDRGTLIVAELHEGAVQGVFVFNPGAAGRSLSSGKHGLEAYRKHTSRRGIEQGNTVDLLDYPRCTSSGS